MTTAGEWLTRPPLSPPEPTPATAGKRPRPSQIIKPGRVRPAPQLTCRYCSCEFRFQLREDNLGPKLGNKIRCPNEACREVLTVPGYCACGERAEQFTSQTAANPGRPYLRCPLSGKCDFFRWVEPDLSEELGPLGVDLQDGQL